MTASVNLGISPHKFFHVNVVVKLENHGSVPATGVKVMMEFVNLANIKERQLWLSENFKRQRDQPGYIVFPTQVTSVWSQMASSTSPGYLQGSTAPERDFIDGVVTGCVDYTIMGGNYGQTFFSFCICDVEATGLHMANYGYMISKLGPDIPKERIVFVPFAWGNSAV